jgi:hypothetical protein
MRRGEASSQKGFTMFVADKPSFTPERFSRRKCTEFDAYPTMLEYEHRYIKWIHRSAYEFFFGSTNNRLLSEFRTNDAELLQRAGESCINYFASAPSFVTAFMSANRVQKDSTIARRLKRLVEWASHWYNDHPTTASALLDKLLFVYARLDMDELWGAMTQKWYDPTTNDFNGRIAFWSKCARSGNWNYISSRLDLIINDTACDSIVANILALSMQVQFWVMKDGIFDFSHSYPPGGLDQFIDSLVKILQGVIGRPGNDTVAQTTRYICIHSTNHYPGTVSFFWEYHFTNASWRESLGHGSMYRMVMLRLAFILNRLPNHRLAPPANLRDTRAIIPASLVDMMEEADLYVAPELELNGGMYLQLSARACVAFYRSLIASETAGPPGSNSSNSKRTGEMNAIGSHVSASQFHRPVRLLCAPSLRSKSTYPVVHPSSLTETFKELESSQFFFIHPGPETSDQLLSLLDYRGRYNIRVRINRGTQQQREKLCEMLLQEIYSDQQGLDTGQQLIAAECVRTSLLDPDSAKAWSQAPEEFETD